MKKTIIKTAVITLLTVIILLSALFGLFFFFFPGTLAKIADKMGNYSFAVSMFERQYLIDKKYDSLKDILIKINEEKDAEKTDKYSTIFIGDEKYISYVKENAAHLFLTEEKTHEFFYGKCVISKVNDKSFSSAIEYAREFIESFSYTEYNPARIVIAEKLSVLSSSEKATLKGMIENYRNSSSPTEKELARINSDLNSL